MTAPALASISRTPSLAHLAAVRVCGVLTEHGRITTSTGPVPTAWLHLTFAPPHGLAYTARLCLGTDAAARQHADGCLPHLRPGALVSVAGTALELCADHATAVLAVRGAHALVIPLQPRTAPAQTPLALESAHVQ